MLGIGEHSAVVDIAGQVVFMTVSRVRKNVAAEVPIYSEFMLIVT